MPLYSRKCVGLWICVILRPSLSHKCRYTLVCAAIVLFLWIIYISNALSTFSFTQKWMYMDLRGNWTGLTCDRLQPVFHRSFHFTQNHATGNRTDPNRAWTATAVRSKPVAVQSGCQFFQFSWTGLLNSSSRCPSSATASVRQR